MATLALLRGLTRGKSAVGDALARGFRVPLNTYTRQEGAGAVRASRTPTANTQTYTAKGAGTWGNNISVTTVVGSLGVSVTFAASTGHPTVTVTAPATATLAANQAVVNAVNAHPTASALVTATLAGTGDAAHAATGPLALQNGANGSGSAERVYVPVTNRATFPVDLDDPKVERVLGRNKNKWVVLDLV